MNERPLPCKAFTAMKEIDDYGSFRTDSIATLKALECHNCTYNLPIVRRNHKEQGKSTIVKGSSSGEVITPQTSFAKQGSKTIPEEPALSFLCLYLRYAPGLRLHTQKTHNLYTHTNLQRPKLRTNPWQVTVIEQTPV